MQNILLEGEHFEPLSPELKIIVSQQHCFNTDTILLMNFAAPKHKEICCDFGTGCGTIPLLWQGRFAPRHIYAIELQKNAFSQALRSVQANNLTDSITVLNMDIKAFTSAKSRPFSEIDLIACNPPYKEMGTGIVNPDSSKAAARHECTLSMEELAAAASASLKFGGRFCMCQRTQRLAEIMNILSEYRLEPKRLQLVQQRDGTTPKLFLLECKKGAKSGLIVEPTLMIEGADGDFSEGMKAIYGNYKYKE